MHFAERLIEKVRAVGNPVLVGIDPRLESLPESLRKGREATRKVAAEIFREFGRGVIDVVADKVAAVKFQAAFYEQFGPEGMEALRDSLEYAQNRGLITIFDGKRNDIGSTAEAYARAYLGKVDVGGGWERIWRADAITVNPYLGSDGIDPFVQVARAEENGIFALVRTSNASAGEFQDLIADGKSIDRHVAARLAEWSSADRGPSGYGLLGAVVGATYPEQLAEFRDALPGVWFLVPGYGAQGGSAEDVAGAFDEDGLGAIVNNSRGVTLAFNRADLRGRFGEDWQRAIDAALDEMIADLAANTRAGRLRPGV